MPYISEDICKSAIRPQTPLEAAETEKERERTLLFVPAMQVRAELAEHFLRARETSDLRPLHAEESIFLGREERTRPTSQDVYSV